MNSPTKKIQLTEWYSILGILVIVGFVYCPIVTNSFNGDDFVHLVWLKQAIVQPELIWRNFYDSWLGLTTAKFYRPLISVFMASDYVVWHDNGIGFHLTNLFSHLINTLLVWLLLRTFAPEDKSINHYIWCLSGALLFGLYPLHTEAVSWITGRVDTFVTLFFLLSLLGYIYWRRNNQKKWLYCSIASFVASLLCKEMAIVLPPVIFMYELVLGRENSNTKNLWQAIRNAFVHSWIFGLILFVYIFWRAYVLGSLIGGYGSSVALSNDRHLLVNFWKHSLYMLFVPFNQNLITSKGFVLLWLALLLSSLILCLKLLFDDKESRKIVLFLVSWVILSLVPVCKLFNILNDLQGSRLAYLATVPLSMVFAIGLSLTTTDKRNINYWQTIPLLLMLSAAGAGLLINNSAWIKAEADSRAVVEQLNKISKTNDYDKFFYFIGLPDQINGAYICRNALEGMTQYPQIAHDMKHCFDLNEIEHRFPFGFSMHSIANVADANRVPNFYVWKEDEQKLERFDISRVANLPMFKTWPGRDLKSLLVSQNKDISFDKEGASFAINTHRYKSDINLNLAGESCFNIDFLVIDYTLQAKSDKGDIIKGAIYPYFKNSLNLNEVAMPAIMYNSNQPQTPIVIPLHSNENWVLGDKCKEFRIELVSTPASKLTIKSISIVPAEKIMPIISFQENASVIGYLEVDKTHPSCHFYYNATKIEQAKNVIVEFAPPNQLFMAKNDCIPEPSTPILPSRTLSGLTGVVSLTKTDFPGPGIYCLRLRALGENNKSIGVAGDHILITVR